MNLSTIKIHKQGKRDHISEMKFYLEYLKSFINKESFNFTFPQDLDHIVISNGMFSKSVSFTTLGNTSMFISDCQFQMGLQVVGSSQNDVSCSFSDYYHQEHSLTLNIFGGRNATLILPEVDTDGRFEIDRFQSSAKFTQILSGKATKINNIYINSEEVDISTNIEKVKDMMILSNKKANFHNSNISSVESMAIFPGEVPVNLHNSSITAINFYVDGEITGEKFLLNSSSRLYVNRNNIETRNNPLRVTASNMDLINQKYSKDNLRKILSQPKTPQ